MKTLFISLFIYLQVPFTSLEVCEIQDFTQYFKQVSKPKNYDQRINITCNKKLIGYFYYKSNFRKLRDELVGCYIKKTNKYYWE